jgi:hypothetical protein
MSTEEPNYSSMSKAELESHLKRLKSNFEDLEQTITFNLANSCSHIGGGQVRKDMDCLEELKAEICMIERILSG